MKRITLRQAARQDWPRILELHREQQAMQGTNYELPWLFGSSIAVALVAVEESGAIRGCIYVETVAELRFVGCDPKATAFGRRDGMSRSRRSLTPEGGQAITSLRRTHRRRAPSRTSGARTARR